MDVLIINCVKTVDVYQHLNFKQTAPMVNN